MGSAACDVADDLVLSCVEAGLRVVTADDVKVYKRIGSWTEYSLNYPPSVDRSAYDAKRYQIRKNLSEIRSVQSQLR